MNKITSLWQRLRSWLGRIFKWRLGLLSGSALSEMSLRMQAMECGEYDQHISYQAHGATKELVSAFNDMAESVSLVIADATADRDRFSIVLSCMADGIMVVDRDARINLINTAAQRIFRLNEAEAVGRSFIEATHNADVFALLRTCLESGKQQSRIVDASSSRLYLGVVVTPLQKNLGCILLVQDLTEVRRLESVRRDFVANVSHELRTPIASLKAISETLNDGAMEDLSVARDFLQLIEVEVDKLAQMINELGELSNIESGAVTLAKTSSDIKLLASSVAERLRTQLNRSEINISIEVPAQFPSVMLDYDRIERVLVNMVHNSMKFTPAGGQIVISATREKGKVVISVADSGAGIEPADLPHIFERFFKADKAHSGGGTGLGLAIARHTVEAHGGRIWAESVFGQGTTIHFSLPAETE